MHPLSNYHAGPNFYAAGLRVTIKYSGKEVDRRVKVSLCVPLVDKESRFRSSEVLVWIRSEYIRMAGLKGLHSK